MRRKTFWGFFLFIISTILLIGCSGDENTTESKSDQTEQKEDETGADKNLTIAIDSDMVSFDIHNHNNYSTEAIHVNMFNYLLKNMRMGKLMTS